MWTQLGLQHGVEQASRCASVDAATCGSTSAIQAFAASSAYGLTIPPETFSVSSPACGSEVSASYSYRFLTGRLVFPNSSGVALTARACFPR
jgi:hypothetical protein